jgi:uncharacterized protein YbjT (DUF2867 family)
MDLLVSTMDRLTETAFNDAMTAHNDSPVLVLGGTGKTGRRVAARLQERGVLVRIGSRSGTPPFDWEDRATWAPALRGTSAAYVSYFPDIAAPGAPETIAELARVALAEDTRRLVLLSGRGEEEALRAEQELQASGADWTIVRCSWFSQNFSEDHLREPVLAGELALPVGDVPEPFVDADDIADVAVAALTDDRHVGELYELTGPRLLTFEDALGEIGAATGRDIRLTRVSEHDYAATLAGHGVPADVVVLLRYLFTVVLDGRNASVADGVQRALGRPARDFRDFALRAAAAGAWR